MMTRLSFNHVSIQEKGDSPFTRLFHLPTIVAMETLPAHASYLCSPSVHDPKSIVATLHDGSTRLLEGRERDEVRRWILGGLALERLARRAADKLAEERLYSLMGVSPSAFEGKTRT